MAQSQAQAPPKPQIELTFKTATLGDAVDMAICHSDKNTNGNVQFDSTLPARALWRLERQMERHLGLESDNTYHCLAYHQDTNIVAGYAIWTSYLAAEEWETQEGIKKFATKIPDPGNCWGKQFHCTRIPAT